MSSFSDDPPVHPNADQGREPHLVPGRMGARLYSLAALRERIEERFFEEYDESPMLREADTSAKRLRLVLDVANYVFAVESVLVSEDEKADLLRQAYSNLFGYGPLDALFLDERITTIAINGADHAAVRYGHGDLQPLKPLFDDSEHLRRIVERLLIDAGTELRDDLPAIETGLRLGDRKASLNVVMPPYSPVMNVDIRLHPPTMADMRRLVASGFMTDEAAALIHAIARSNHGIVIVGESEAGKTTLLSAAAAMLPETDDAVAVERAGEAQLPEAFERLTVRWALGDQTGVSFGEQIETAIAGRPSCIVLDEVRSDESMAIAPLLEAEFSARQIWVVRGVPDAKRLQSALGMLARRSNPDRGEAPVHALYERLPFVLTTARIQGQLKLFSIAEWQPSAASDYPDYVMLMQYREGAARPTGNPPFRRI